ncbi:putative target SNARE coiled-coil domain, RNA polymerase II assembly factor Rtp1 domain 2 [Plasmopara halstedii]
MATRDITRQFLQLRADEKAKVLRRKNIVSHREEGSALIKSEEQEVASVVIAPVWVDVVNVTNQHVTRIKGMMEKLNKLHANRLMVRFDGQESKYEREIDQLTQDITDEFRNAEKGLRRMAQSDRNGEFSAADAKTRQNVQRALATQLQTLSGDFRKSQKTYLTRVKNQKEGPVEFDFLAENETKQNRRGGADTGFTQAQITEVEIAEDVINERDQEIQRIATSITELATIFKELAVLVIDQGTILDRIDYNMEQVVEQTEKGIEELEKAEETQKNSRPMKCIGLLLVMIFIMTVLLVLKHSVLGLMLNEPEQQLQALMRSLRLFVDTLRDIKNTEDNDAIASNIVKAVRKFCELPEASNGLQLQDEAWRHGLVPTFQRLYVCMTRLDELEAMETEVRFEQRTSRGDEKPKAPAGLLSLRDYSVLQAAVELLFCWTAYPRVAAGILIPIEKRRPTRTLKISKNVLLWGYREYGRENAYKAKLSPTTAETLNELLLISKSMLQLLLLPQFQPILLPTYVVDLLALLVYGEVATDTPAPTLIQKDIIGLREMLLKILPLRMAISSLRGALGQAAPVDEVGKKFKARCGTILSRLLMEDGGIVATIESFLGSVEEGNTQARMQVATLICQSPSGEGSEEYPTALCAQVCKLLLAAVTPENGVSKLIGEMAALLADQLATRHPILFDTQILSVLFHPLLIYEDSRLSKSFSLGDTSEEALNRCVSIVQLLLCGPPPSQDILQALAPIIRPLLHMYAFAVTSKSFLATPLRASLISFIRSCSNAALLLQMAVLPVTVPLRPSLLTQGYERTHNKMPWTPLREFCAGGNGGVSLRLVSSSHSTQGVKSDPIESLKGMIIPIVELLGYENLESSHVVGDLFASLLLTYMHFRKNGEAESIHVFAKNGTTTHPLALYDSVKNPTSTEGIQMILLLLVTLIERLGPSVLRSADVVLQCIGTVLRTYDTPTSKLVDEEEQNKCEVDLKEGDEILAICLGVALTILEAGSSNRSESEEQHLRAMLPVLETLSCHSRPEIAELASTARAHILSREAKGVPATKGDEQSFEEVLQSAEQDFLSKLVPLRARGVVTLTKLVRRSHMHNHDTEWTPRVHALARVFLLKLHDSESYVYLAAVQGLAALADAHPDVAIPVLVKALRDTTNPLEIRIKLSEALLFAARRCGETLPAYSKLFVYAYLDCIRAPFSQREHEERFQESVVKRTQLIQEVLSENKKVEEVPHRRSEEELLATATLRASCLSNLAEVCALLQWGLQPFLLDVLTCVFGVLQLELEQTSTHYLKSGSNKASENDEQQKVWKHQEEEKQQRIVAVRRGAVFVLRYLVEMLGWKMLELMPDQLSPLYHTLKHVAHIDRDSVVIFHAARALSALNEVMRAELFPLVEHQDEVFGISSLRIL